MKRLSTFLLALILNLGGLSHADDRDYQLITQGGGEVALGESVPGLIDLTSDTAFPLLQDTDRKILAAADTSGPARAVAFSHGSFLKGDTLISQPGVAALVVNATRWAGKSGQPKVGIHPGLPELLNAMNQAGIDASAIPPSELKPNQVAVYCTLAQKDLSESDIASLTAFANAGGGLVISATPWAFKKDYPEFGAAFPGNRLLAGSGLRLLPDGYAKGSAPLAIGTGTKTDGPKVAMKPSSPAVPAPPEPIGSGSANKKSKATAAAEALAESAKTLSPGERDRLIVDLKSGASLSGDSLTDFLASLLKLNQAIGPIVPTSETPIRPGADPLIDAVVTLENDLNQSLPAGAMYAIPAASNYPGAIPEDANRETVTLSIDGKYRGWISGRGAGFWAAKEMRPTGVYAAPGEVVKVTVPARLAGDGFEVVIGAYNGGLENRDTWQRYPRLMRAFPITNRVTEASNGLGGLVTIRVPKEADYESIEVTIEGGVRSPLFVEGQTDLSKWKSEIRKYPAPWAEIAGKRIILALPSEYVRRLEDPDKLMGVWDGIIEKAAELCGGVDRDQYRAERIVFERQTSAGYMHSGYPVAAPQDKSVAMAVDSRALKS
ncbi:MAG: M60 family metallopeptidase, partial [Verrucomicrobiae bacterium]|nr:M60 family metallopeptidase [Verrucomicrobiae bacterium]